MSARELSSIVYRSDPSHDAWKTPPIPYILSRVRSLVRRRHDVKDHVKDELRELQLAAGSCDV